MTDAHPHYSVMLAEVIQALAPQAGELMIDATFGAGGYSRALLDAGARVIAFDRDPAAAAFAAPLITQAPDRFELVRRPFSELEDGWSQSRIAGGQAPQGIVFDIGVSSMQLDQAERGFSFMRDGPLDMRMSSEGRTAADFVNEESPADLARLFWVYGEERASRRIAAFIARRRAETPFTRTLDLAETVERAVGGRKGAPTHPATRVFQALRIAVNDELGELESGLAAAERILAPGGRLAVVTFHSLEDRMVKTFLAERAGKTGSVSRHQPEIRGHASPSFTLKFNGHLGPSAPELAENPRSRSAKLRAAVRTSAPCWRKAA